MTKSDSDVGQLVAGARVISVWTLASRVTGFLRVAAIAAIIGPTFFGNLLQTALYVPFLLSEVLAATLIPAVLAPRIVRHLRAGDDTNAKFLARGFLGAILPLFCVIAVIGVVATPFLLSFITAAVDDTAIRSQQIALGWPLLLLLLPQVVLHAFIATAAAVQHAHHRFGITTAAQIVENLGLVVVLLVAAMAFGFGSDLDTISVGHVVAIGAGSTLVVALHAAVQWWGAARLGYRLIPIAGWRHAEVRGVLRSAIPAGSASALNGVGWIWVLVAAGHFPGGAVAFQIGQSLYNLPISLFSRPFAISQLPLLARVGQRSTATFQMMLERSLRLALFVAIPAGVGFVAFPEVLAGAVSFGEMETAIDLVAMAVLGLGVGLVAEAVYVVYSSAAYAQLDKAAQLRAAAFRAAILAPGLLFVHYAAPDSGILLIALTCSAATAIAAVYLRLRAGGDRQLGGLGEWPKWLLANSLVAVVAAIPAVIVAKTTTLDGSQLERVLAAGSMVSLTIAIYLALQWLLRSDELRMLLRRNPLPPPAAGVTVHAGKGNPA